MIKYITLCFFKITGAVTGTSREKLYQELLFESLQQRCWYRYIARKSENIPQLRTKHDILKKLLSPSTIKEWNNLDPETRKS